MGVIRSRIKHISVCLLILCFAGCSRSADCLVADTVTPVGVVTVNGADAHVFVRTSGFNDKQHVYELYDQTPTFDSCGHTALKPRSDAAVDPGEGTVESLVVSAGTLSIQYAKGKQQVKNLAVVPIETR